MTGAASLEDFHGSAVRFANKKTESNVDFVALKNDEDEECTWQFQLQAKHVNDLPGGFLRISNNGVLNPFGKKGGPRTRFHVLLPDGSKAQSLLHDIQLCTVGGKNHCWYVSLDRDGRLTSSKEASTLNLVVSNAHKDNNATACAALFKCAAACGRVFCSPATTVVTVDSTKAFWSSLGGALLTCIGSSLFWIGFWTELDLAVPQSNFRDFCYILAGFCLALLTDSFGLSFNTVPLQRRLNKNSIAIATVKAARIRIAELETYSRRPDDALAKKQSAALASSAAEKARATLIEKENKLTNIESETGLYRWLNLLTGDREKDQQTIINFMLVHGSVQMIVGLIGNTFLWIGLCNMICIPSAWLGKGIAWLVGLIFSPFVAATTTVVTTTAAADYDYDSGNSSVNSTAAYYDYVDDTGIHHVVNTSSDLIQVAIALCLLNLSGGLAGLSKQQGSIKDPWAWLSTWVGILGGCTLWISMSDVLETQFTIKDENGYADHPDGIWRETTYICIGFLSQVSTELVSGAAAAEGDDPWHLPTVYDVVSTVGAVMLNSAVWVLIDSQISLAWENCSTDGSVGADFNRWPSCKVRNILFIIVGMIILMKQRSEMDEAGVSSSPVMSLAVKSVRKAQRREEEEQKREVMQQFATIIGEAFFELDALPKECKMEKEDIELCLPEELSQCIHVPAHRIKAHVADENSEERCEHGLRVTIQVIPPTITESSFLLEIGVSQHWRTEQLRASKALHSAFSLNISYEPPNMLAYANLKAGFHQFSGPYEQFQEPCQQQVRAKAKAKLKAKVLAKAKARMSKYEAALAELDVENPFPKAKAKSKGKAKAKASASPSLEDPLLENVE